MSFSRGIWLSRALRVLMVVCALGTAAQAQDRHDWQSLAQLNVGDRVRLSLRTGQRLEGAFHNWTPERVTIGIANVRKEDVLKLERYRSGAWGRGKKAAVGAAIGFGGGFVTGVGICSQQRSGCLINPIEGAIFLGATFAIIGGGIGALLPLHNKDVVYSVK